MKQLIYFVVTAVITISVMNACGPSEEELERRQQARQDSIEQARQDSLEQARKDSIAQARQDSIEAAKRRKARLRELNRIEYEEDGPISVQVGSWRSKQKAQEQSKVWKQRGYENAYVVQYGEENTGNVWFRVRLGKVGTMKMAEKLVAKIERNHGKMPTWIAPEQPSSTMPDTMKAE